MSLFADDTTILGTAREMRAGCDAVKETMLRREEQIPQRRETPLWHGEVSGHQNAWMLGGPKKRHTVTTGPKIIKSKFLQPQCERESAYSNNVNRTPDITVN